MNTEDTCPCPTCAACGVDENDDTCPRCDGSGSILRADLTASDIADLRVTFQGWERELLRDFGITTEDA